MGVFLYFVQHYRESAFHYVSAMCNFYDAVLNHHQ